MLLRGCPVWTVTNEQFEINYVPFAVGNSEQNSPKLSINVAVPMKICLDTYKVNKHNNHTVYGIKGGSPLRNWRDKQTPIV